MGLKERLESGAAITAKQLFARFGIIDNPFPAAGQTSGHPRLEDKADDAIASAVESFRKNQRSQVLVVLGTQGVGKTNLLSYYEGQLRELYENDRTFYVIRYYADPEPGFEGLLRGIFQELGTDFLKRVGESLQARNDAERAALVQPIRSADLRAALQHLAKDPQAIAPHLLEWLLGFRILKRHQEGLGVYHRLDTVESRTQVLRDIVTLGARLKQLRGIFLLLDELEKQAGVLSRTLVVRYLFALRALIDALPEHLFLVLAMTPAALRFYGTLVPAIVGRLQSTVELRPIQSAEDAQRYYKFYLDSARQRAVEHFPKGNPGSRRLLDSDAVEHLFEESLKDSRQRGIDGVLQREFLQLLRDEVQHKISTHSAE